MRGRKSELKLVMGTPPRTASAAAAAEPEPPSCLDQEALAEWKRLAPMLVKTGTLTRVDRAVLAAHCQAWSCWSEAERNLNEYGRVVLSPRGLPAPSPWLQVSAMAQQQLIRSGCQLGLTPVARAKVKAAPVDADDSAADRFFRAVNG